MSCITPDCVKLLFDAGVPNRQIFWAASGGGTLPGQRFQKVLLAVRAPVASDIRVPIAVLRAVSELERMCALARHIAKIVRLKHPRTAIPDGVAPVSARVGVLAARQAHGAASTIETRDPRSVGRLARADHELDVLVMRQGMSVFSSRW